jgi:CBS domain-containing protein
MARRVLVVDDNRALARTLGELLSAAGAEARVFDSSRRALEWATENVVDAALIDLGVPEVDGAHLVDEIHRVAPDARRFLMAGTTDDARITHLTARGVAGVFRKPFSPARVVDVLVPRARTIELGPARVASAMSRDVTACAPEDDVAEAARLMWEHDRGFVVVLDGHGRLAGVLTDRDVCMAAYARGRALHEISVATVMSRPTRTCAPDDTLEQAARTMREGQLRRLPVIDATGRVAGVLSLADLVRAGEHLDATTMRTLRSILAESARAEPRVA